MAVIGGPNLIKNGLVSMWDVASPESSPGSGTVWTDLIGNNDGTLTNSPITAEGINQGVISFDGTDDHVVVPSNFTNDLSSEATVSMWFYYRGGDTYPYIFGAEDSGGANTLSLILDGTADPEELTFSVKKDSTQTNLNSSTGSISKNRWYNVVGVVDATHSYIYIDGVLDASGTAGGSAIATITSSKIATSASNPTNRELDGNIAVVAIYNRALTAAEIKQNYNATKGRFSVTPSIVKENLVLHLDAGDSDSYGGSGTTWTDLAGSNDATLTNGPVYSSAGGGSFALDGTNDYAEVASHSSFQFGSDTDFTLEIWFRFDDYASGGSAWDRPLITNFLQSPTPRTGWLLGLAGSSYGTGCEGQARSIIGNSLTYGVDFGPGTDPTYGSGTDGTLINDGNWHHLLLTVDRDGNAVIYVNGVAEATASYGTTADIDNTKELWIGRHQATYSTLTLEGNISTVRIYNKSLTSGEVLQNYEAQKGRFV